MNIPSHMRSLIGVLKSAATADEIKAYCAASIDIVADIRLTDTTLADAPTMINGGADIVVIETGAANADDIGVLEKLCAHVARGESFIVIMDDPSADTMRRLFRAGVTDVLATPVAPAELVAALNSAQGRKSESVAKSKAADGKIVAIINTAGGVGATTLATNIGAALAGSLSGKVVLADLDIQFGGVATALNLRPRMSVLDAVKAGSRLDATLLTSTFCEHACGVFTLAAPRDITPLEAIPDGFIDRLFSALRASAALSIVELPAAWTLWTGEALGRSDIFVPVAETSVRCAAGAARINQSLIDFGLAPMSAHLLLNKYEKSIENNARAKKIGEIFGVKPAGAIRLDAKAAQEAADRGLLFADAAPKSAATKDFETVAKAIAAKLDLKLAPKVEGAAPLSRILGGRPMVRGRA